jgi:thiamine transport system substrate-binding protein
MFVYPVNQKATLPEVFTENAAVPAEPFTMEPDRIAAERDTWLRAWRDTVEG